MSCDALVNYDFWLWLTTLLWTAYICIHKCNSSAIKISTQSAVWNKEKKYFWKINSPFGVFMMINFTKKLNFVWILEKLLWFRVKKNWSSFKKIRNFSSVEPVLLILFFCLWSQKLIDEIMWSYKNPSLIIWFNTAFSRSIESIYF